jgi:hypothetical protein
MRLRTSGALLCAQNWLAWLTLLILGHHGLLSASPPVDLSTIEKTGVYRIGDSIAVAAILPWDGDRRRLEQRARIQVFELYLGLLDPPSATEKLIAKTQYGIETIARARERVFSTSARVVENRREPKSGATYRMVFLFDHKLGSTLSSAVTTNILSHRYIQSIYKKPEAHLDLFTAIGFPDVTLALTLRAFSIKHSLHNVFRLPSDPIAYRETYASALRSVEVTNPYDLLSKWPGHSDAIQRLTLETDSSDEMQRLALEAQRCSSSTSQFSQEVDTKFGGTVNARSGFPLDGLLAQVVSCRGFVVFEQGLSERTPSQFNEIISLFETGNDLERALRLCLSAVQESPRNVRAWVYLAAALRASGSIEHAVIAARVAFMLDPYIPSNLATLLQHRKPSAALDAGTFVDALILAAPI